MPEDDFVAQTLKHGNLQVDVNEPTSRPMIAILDAKPGMVAEFREKIIELVRGVRGEPGCSAFIAYEARDIEGRFNDALRRLANRLVGILHGCLKTRTLYNEATAWSHRQNLPQSDVAA